MLITRHYVVRGRVQGVGFRYFAQAAASALGLRGWVRNVPDGQVEAVAEGDTVALARFEQALKTGPAGSRVEQVDVGEWRSDAPLTDFRIR